MPHNSTAIVPASGPLSWGAITGKPATAPDRTISAEGRVLKHGELRQVTRTEEISALYGLDANDHYQRRTIDQITAIDRVSEAWGRHLEHKIERPEFHDAKGAANTVAADIHNVGSLLGDILFGG